MNGQGYYCLIWEIHFITSFGGKNNNIASASGEDEDKNPLTPKIKKEQIVPFILEGKRSLKTYHPKNIEMNANDMEMDDQEYILLTWAS